MRARYFALIPAAGGHGNFGGTLPERYADLEGKPLLARTLVRLSSARVFDAIFVALPPEDSHYHALIGKHDGVVPLYCGGNTRRETVTNALVALESRCAGDDWVAVHDATRPCVPGDALRRLVDELADDPVGGLLAIPVADTLKCEDPVAPVRVLRTRDRAGLWQSQAPQMFRYQVLRSALAGTPALAATDEAEAVEAFAASGACALPSLVVGSALNIKVTVAADLTLAAAILAAQEQR